MKILITKLLVLMIALIISTDIFPQYLWEKYEGNPLMLGGEEGKWDKHVFQPMVLYNPDSSRYEMYYAGSFGTPLRPFSIGVAYSPDGINWAAYTGNPVLSPDSGSWDEGSVETPWVIRQNGEYKMWYYGGTIGTYTDGIGYAISPDGINWTKQLTNPVLSAGSSSWENHSVYSPSVFENDAGTYIMYYTGYPVNWRSQIGRAYSSDGILWIRDTINNPVLPFGESGQWDEEYIQSSPCLYFYDTLYLWYFGAPLGAYNGFGIGQAFSTDEGATWTKSSFYNPVIQKGAPLSWDENAVEYPFALLKSDSIYLYYGGWGTDGWKIGLAKAKPPVPLDVPDISTVPVEFLLSNNYPNPFNPGTTINYSIPEESKVSLRIYDVLGKETAILVNKESAAGTYKITWDAVDLPTGIYFYQLKAGNFVQTKKMMLIK